jgi:hypothetical protein
VTDFETTQAISGVMVDIVANANTTFAKQSRQTGNDGKFAFKDLEAGNYKLSFSRSGYLENNQDVNILAGQTASSDVRLTPASPFKVQGGVLVNYSGTERNIVIPDNLGITAIGDNVFENSMLLSAVIPEGVINIGSCAFKNCKHLVSVTFPNTLKTIGIEAFYWCEALTAIDIPNNVTTIERSAFFLCYKATSLVISNKATTIGMYAFGSCRNLMFVTIPASVTNIGERAFNNCTGLTRISVNWITPLNVSDETFGEVPVNAVILNVPSGTKASYQTTNVWKNFGTITEFN